MHSNISLTIYSTLNTALFPYGITGTIDSRTATTDYKNVNALSLADLYLITVITSTLIIQISRQTTICINTVAMADRSSSYTSNFSTARRIPTTMFDSIVPSDKMSTWHEEDAKAKSKRSSAELAARAKTTVRNTLKSASHKADQIKKVVDKAKAKRDTDKQIRKAEKENQQATNTLTGRLRRSSLRGAVREGAFLVI
ncbi:unnamed protein product [Alternaria alternata]|jgi:hypothetical protein